MDAVIAEGARLPGTVLAPGELLIREGDSRRAIYVLIDGTAEVFKGTVRVARIRAPGALSGEMSTLLDAPIRRRSLPKQQ